MEYSPACFPFRHILSGKRCFTFEMAEIHFPFGPRGISETLSIIILPPVPIWLSYSLIGGIIDPLRVISLVACQFPRLLQKFFGFIQILFKGNSLSRFVELNWIFPPVTSLLC
jgi:hypothetical protein